MVVDLGPQLLLDDQSVAAAADRVVRLSDGRIADAAVVPAEPALGTVRE
ncbi:MAG TPA: hypothetical protein VF155_05080 [Candidatus Dormibacteraeota bacterium]